MSANKSLVEKMKDAKDELVAKIDAVISPEKKRR